MNWRSFLFFFPLRFGQGAFTTSKHLILSSPSSPQANKENTLWTKLIRERKGGTWRTSERVASAHLLRGLQLCPADRGMIWISVSLGLPWQGKGREQKKFAGMERTLLAISSQRKPSKGQKRGKSKGGVHAFPSVSTQYYLWPLHGCCYFFFLLLYFNDWLTPHFISKCTCRFTASSIVTFLVGEGSKRIWTLSPTGSIYINGIELDRLDFVRFLLSFSPFSNPR